MSAPIGPWSLRCSFDMDDAGLDDKANAAVGKRMFGAGSDGLTRDMEWRFRTEAGANAAMDRLRCADYRFASASVRFVGGVS